MAGHQNERFFESTRGQIVTLLRRSGLTVEELARALGLTDNGIRAHLTVLERDGIVRQRGSVRRSSGGGKPAHVYELTQEAEELFPKAYEPALRRLLDVLSERLGPEESEALLRSVGRRLAEEYSARTNAAHAQLESAVKIFNELGGLAKLEERDGTLVIRSYSCPLAGVSPDHPEVCRMAETMITELAGVPVYEHCDRGERPRCCFEVATTDSTPQE
ncbi:MAG: helix-turn-helix domain-containing protein [Actinomycetota bacterium]|nr:helix-turn-helix domain-containing protein [Actinomycetota bacterium]